MTTTTDLERSTFQKRPAYRYIRPSDKLPTYAHLPGDTVDSDDDGILCPVKLFNPTGVGTWWIASYDPDTRVAWGVAEIHEKEVGSFSMAELVPFRGRFGLPIERDLYYTPQTLAQILNGGEVVRTDGQLTDPADGFPSGEQVLAAWQKVRDDLTPGPVA